MARADPAFLILLLSPQRAGVTERHRLLLLRRTLRTGCVDFEDIVVDLEDIVCFMMSDRHSFDLDFHPLAVIYSTLFLGTFAPN